MCASANRLEREIVHTCNRSEQTVWELIALGRNCVHFWSRCRRRRRRHKEVLISMKKGQTNKSLTWRRAASIYLRHRRWIHSIHSAASHIASRTMWRRNEYIFIFFLCLSLSSARASTIISMIFNFDAERIHNIPLLLLAFFAGILVPVTFWPLYTVSPFSDTNLHVIWIAFRMRPPPRSTSESIVVPQKTNFEWNRNPNNGKRFSFVCSARGRTCAFTFHIFLSKNEVHMQIANIGGHRAHDYYYLLIIFAYYGKY